MTQWLIWATLLALMLFPPDAAFAKKHADGVTQTPVSSPKAQSRHTRSLKASGPRSLKCEMEKCEAK